MSKKNGNPISLNKVSFWLLVTAAFLYLLGMVFSFIPALSSAFGILLAVASAMMLCVVAILAWRYVAHKEIVWKVLYFIVLLVALVGLILPNILVLF